MTIRAAALAVLILLAVHVPFFFIEFATGEEPQGALHDLAVITTVGAIVAAGVISGFVAASLAGSGHPRRRAATVVSFVLMTATVGLTLVLLDLAAGASVDGWLITATFIVTGVIVLLGSLLGYIAGRERRLAGERSAMGRT